MKKVVDRFFNYVVIDTKSEDDSPSFPSSNKQFDLANLLVKELKELGLNDASVDENCYVMATLPSNTDKTVPTIGFIAHMDTSPDISGENVKPKTIENYDGRDIILNKENNIVLSSKDFPELKKYIGKTLITTDGTTLLGADDKAGIAEIMTAIEYLVNNPQIKHGDIKVAFTPDEEVGRGADYFNVEKYGADFAYTVDGGELGELEYENFNAAGVKLVIKGRNVHPGTAKNKMINSIEIAMELNSMLPENQKPKYTEGYEGFFLLSSLNGDVEETKASYIIRDHFKDRFEEKKALMQKVVDFLNAKYGKDTVHAEIKDQYYNMKEKIEPVMHIVDTAKKAMEKLGITPIIKPVRGGTDGSRLSYMGLPCPNLFTGGHNYHGKYEFICAESMESAVEVVLKIVELYSI